MRHLGSLLVFAARSLQNIPAAACPAAGSGSQLLAAPRGAAAASAYIQRLVSNAVDIAYPSAHGLARFSTDATKDDEPHRRQREPSAEVRAHDMETLEQDLSSADAAEAAGAAAAVSPDAADSAAAADPEQRLAELGFKLEDVSEADGAALLARESPDDEDSDSDSDSSDEEGSSSDDEDELALMGVSDGEGEDEGVAAAADPEAESEEPNGLAAMTQADSLLAEIQSASKKRQKFLLQQALSGKSQADQLDSDVRRPDIGDFSMKVVDVNRTSRGSKKGRVPGYAAIVVVGNNDGILGLGTGKASEAKSAVDKATRKALRHLTYVPRFRAHTIHAPTNIMFGKTKMLMFPRSSGTGVKASNLMKSVCQLAGIRDVGIKIQGSRNLRNSVNALFKAFDELRERVDEDSIDAAPHPSWPPPELLERYAVELQAAQQGPLQASA